MSKKFDEVIKDILSRHSGSYIDAKDVTHILGRTPDMCTECDIIVNSEPYTTSDNKYPIHKPICTACLEAVKSLKPPLRR